MAGDMTRTHCPPAVGWEPVARLQRTNTYPSRTRGKSPFEGLARLAGTNHVSCLQYWHARTVALRLMVLEFAC
jgi:hypothetical protein